MMNRHFIFALCTVLGFSVSGISMAQSVPTDKEAAAKAAKEGSTVAEVRTIFDKAAQIDDISSIKGADLEVTKRGDKIVVSYQYAREIALAGPAYLVYRFKDEAK